MKTLADLDDAARLRICEAALAGLNQFYASGDVVIASVESAFAAEGILAGVPEFDVIVCMPHYHRSYAGGDRAAADAAFDKWAKHFDADHVTHFSRAMTANDSVELLVYGNVERKIVGTAIPSDEDSA